jgi:uncharacterized protein
MNNGIPQVGQVPLPSGDTPTHWGAWPALLAGVMILAGSALAAVGVIRALRLVAPAAVMADGTFQLLTGMLATQVAVVGLVWFVLRRWPAAAVPGIALDRSAGGVGVYLVSLLAMLAVVVVYNTVLILIAGHDPLTDLKTFSPMIKGPWWPMAFLAIGIGAPLSEEILFRGFLQSALARSQIGFWGAALVTTTLWTLLHWGYTAIGLGEVFLIGLVFAALLRRTGSLRIPLFCHAAYNSALVLAVKLYPGAL